MKLHQLFTKYNWDEISTRFFQLYPDQEKNADGYAAAYKELAEMQAGTSNYNLVIDHVISTEQDHGYEDDWYHVYAVDKNVNIDQRWAIDYMEWADCLDLEIAPTTLSEQDILSHIMYELTFYGYSSSEVTTQRSAIMDNAFDEIEFDDEEDWETTLDEA